MNTSTDNTSAVRQKSTNIDKVLPPVAQLISENKTQINYIDLAETQQQIDFANLVDRDPMPLPYPVDREGYGTVENTPRYWATGLCDWLNVKQAMGRYLEADTQTRPIRILDFGCATGRFLRHCWADRSEMNLENWGCDFSPQNVDWSKRYLDPEIRIFLNNDTQHLPFSDGHFDVVTAFSVFTHIDAFEDAWLLELRRITRAGGLLYLTVQNEATWKQVLQRPGCLEHLQNANNVAGNPAVTKSLFEQPMSHDRLPLRMSNANIYNCNVWMSNKYIEQNWGRYFNVLEIANRAHNSYQSVVLLSPLNSDTAIDPKRPR